MLAHIHLKPKPFPKASFGSSFVSNAKYALTGPLLEELWRIISIANMQKYLNYSQRQVLVFQMILYVYFALKLSDLVSEWRTIFEAWTILKGPLLDEFWRIISIAIMQQYLNYSQRQVLVFQMILYVYFALKLSDLVREWRTIFVAYMYLKPEPFPKPSFGCSFVSTAKYAPTGPLIDELCRIISIAIMQTYLNYSKTSFVISNDFVCVFCT